jgi:hypothetical protein
MLICPLQQIYRVHFKKCTCLCKFAEVGRLVYFVTAGRTIQPNRILIGLHIHIKCVAVICLTSISKSKRLNAARNSEQKWAILGTSHHDCISARNYLFFTGANKLLQVNIILKKVYTDTRVVHVPNILQTLLQNSISFERRWHRCPCSYNKWI